MYRVRDGRYSYHLKYAYEGRETKGRVFDRNEARDDRYQGAHRQNYNDLPTTNDGESVERGTSVAPPNNDPAGLRSKRDELWVRGRKEAEMEKIEATYADLKIRKAALEEQIKEREKEERKRERNNEGRGGARSRPGGVCDFSEPPRRFGNERECYKRAPSVPSRGKAVMGDSLEKWGDSESYNKRRRNE